MSKESYDIIKLQNGVDVYAKTQGTWTGGLITVVDPLTLLIRSDPMTGQVFTFFTRWEPFTDDEKISISTDKIMTVVSMSSLMRQWYDLGVRQSKKFKEEYVDKAMLKNIENLENDLNADEGDLSPKDMSDILSEFLQTKSSNNTLN